MMSGHNSDEDIISYMELCDFDLPSSSNSVPMDLNIPDFALFNDPTQNDFTLGGINLNQTQIQNPNHYATFEAMNPNPNPNNNLNHNDFPPPLHPFFRTEVAETGQDATHLSLNQHLHMDTPFLNSINSNNSNNNHLFANNNIASSSRGETDVSRQSRKRPESMPPQQNNRVLGVTMNPNSSSSSSSHYFGITNNGALESAQGNNHFVRNTRMRGDPLRTGPLPLNPNYPQYSIAIPNPNPNSNPNPYPNPNPNPSHMLGIPVPSLYQNNSTIPSHGLSSIPRSGTVTNLSTFQAIPIPRTQNPPGPVMTAVPRRVIFNPSLNNNNQARIDNQGLPVQIPTGNAQANDNNNNGNNNNLFMGFNVGGLHGSDNRQRPPIRRFMPTMSRPRTAGTAGGTVPVPLSVQVPSGQNLSRRRERTQFILDQFRHGAQDNRRRVARQVLGILRPGDDISLEEVILFEQSVLFGNAIPDRHRDMRLDVDNMSYEELLALEERIGNVSTGLSEEIIMKKLKQRFFVPNLSLSSDCEIEPCCICQEEYNEGDKVGRLDCGHDFHTACVIQWLVQKNVCPICKKPGLNA